MSETTSGTPGRKPGWMKILLILSLGLNLLFVGLSAGAILREDSHKRDHGDRGEREIGALGLRFYYRALGDQSKSALDRAIASDRARIRAGRDSYRAHLTALAQAISAEPYSPEAVHAVLDAQSKAVGDNIALGHEMLLERIAAMSPDERKKMAKRLTEGASRADRRRRD